MDRAAREIELSDADLVARAQGGDAAAFAGLVSRYQDRVYNVCHRMCHNHADALDLTQTTFLKALEALPRFEARANFYTWLFRIATNLTLSHHRAARRRRTASLDASGFDGRKREPVRNEDGPAQAAAQQELHGRVAEALARLDEEFRAPVVLKDIADMDYATIAQILEVPLGTVKSRIHRGRLLLRAMLTEERSERGRARV
ncbi:MAG: sigma-70 family RNA polymerase sigma factor [Planctomycetes bacterium]|nr:sigma-70 family RNA polymerase sigma factor [Planctomycetota bacterium]